MGGRVSGNVFLLKTDDNDGTVAVAGVVVMQARWTDDARNDMSMIEKSGVCRGGS